LRSLGSSELIDSLIDEVFIRRLCIECLFQGDVCFPQSSIGYLALVFAFRKDYANPLALFGREAKLLDRVRIHWRHILRIIRRSK
jgi:hypothetical protein